MILTSFWEQIRYFLDKTYTTDIENDEDEIIIKLYSILSQEMSVCNFLLNLLIKLI